MSESHEIIIVTVSAFKNKEFIRRRKVADSVIAHQMDQRLQLSSTVSTSTAASNPIYNEKLPTIADRIYDEAVVRIWDFLHCFSDAFVTEGSNDTLPTLDSLQDAIYNLRKGRSNSKMHRAAVALLEKVAIMICQAISPGLTKQLAAAAYLSDVNKGSADETASLPVTSQTWREVARMSIIGDLLIDLGYSKVESANIVKVSSFYYYTLHVHLINTHGTIICRVIAVVGIQIQKKPRDGKKLKIHLLSCSINN